MVDYFINEGTKFIIQHWKRIFLLAIAGFAIFFVIKTYLTYAILNVEVNTAAIGNKEAQIFINADAVNTNIGGPGLHIIPRSTKGIIVRSGNNIRTQSTIDIPWYGYASKSVKVKRDKNADKIAYKSTLDDPCRSYDQKNDRVLSYDCSNTEALTYYSAPSVGTWEVKSLANNLFFPNFSPVPYMGGIIGTAYNGGGDVIPPGFITVVGNDGALRYYQHPETIDLYELDKVRIFTDTNDQSNNRFVLVAATGEIYLGTPSSDPKNTHVDYKVIAKPNNYDSTLEQTLCSVRGISATCYRGLSPNIGDVSSGSDKVKPEITKLSFADSSSETHPVDDRAILSKIIGTSDGRVYGLNYKQLVYFERDGSEYKTISLAQNVDDAGANDSVFFLQDGGVFTVDPATQDSYQVFYSLNIQPNKLIVSGGNVIIFGRAANTRDYTYAWKLNNEFDANYSNRLIDILPSFPASAAYGKTDIVGRSIYLEVPFGVTDTDATVLRKKQATLDYLSTLGIDINQVTIANL